jgi:puromycin-sensitive aminopeptidase
MGSQPKLLVTFLLVRFALSVPPTGGVVFRQIASAAARSALTSLVVALSFTAGASAANNAESDKAILPGGIVPVSYKIFVEPYAEDGVFSGTESIDLEVTEPSNKIVLNSVDLKVQDAEYQMLDSSKRTRSQKLKVHYEHASQQLVLESPDKIGIGKYVVSMKFHGTLNDKLRGFFRVSFLDPAGTKHWMAATQMEATDARRMFPCFDEPQYKATFKISTSIDPADTAISNSPEISESTDAKTKRKIVSFEASPKMSTYLVALIVGRLVPSKTSYSEGVPIRVWCTPGKEKLTQFSQGIADRAMKYYTDYFDVPYPAKKLDLIAIPDFSNGAMENLGAATFREDLLLVDEKQSSLDAKQQAALNITHEMAHMWFGDLVTMKWWDDIWLNEAFAEWISTKAVDKLEPEWHYWNQFALERDQSMLSDSLRATRAIHSNVTNPDQIEQMFDEITYEKGASVMRMLEQFVGDVKFRNGIRQYIKSNEYGNATGENLWSAISAQCGKDVSEIMHTWVYQEGYPLVSLASVDPTNAKMDISQKRFTFKRSQQSATAQTIWDIPLTVRSLDDSETSSDAGTDSEQVLVDCKNGKLGRVGAAPLLVNAGGEGYYRVQYSADELNKITAHLDKLTVLEKASLLSDQFNLALSGQIPVDDYLYFTRVFKNETDPTITSVLCSEMNQIDLMTEDSSRADFAAFVCDRLSKMKNTYGWSAQENESDLVRHARGEVMLTLGTIGQDKSTIEEAREVAEKIFAHDRNAKIDSELIDPVIKIVAYNGDVQDYSKIETLWHQAKTPDRELSALMALALFRQPELMQKTLKMCLTDQVRRQDAPQVIAAVMEQRDGRGAAWEFFHKHIIHLVWRLSGQRLFNIVMAMNSLATEQQLSEVQAFFRKHPVPSQSRGINKIIEAIEVRVAFRQRSGHELSTWLAANAAPQTIKISSRHPEFAYKHNDRAQ